MRVHIICSRTKEKPFLKALGEGDEIWGLNAIRPDWVPYWSKMFNLHTFQNLRRYKWPVKRELEWVKENPNVPFYVIGGDWPEDYRATALPMARMEEMPRGRYHCGSFDWMVAFATCLHVGFYWGESLTEIHLHNIGLCLEAGEPISARACLEYWCGYAEAMGIRIVPHDCDIFHFYHLVKSTMIYGIDDTPIFEDRSKRGAPYTYEK